MRITGIHVRTLRYEYPQQAGFHFAGGYCNARLSSLVEIDTDAGLSGNGSVYSHPALVKLIVEEHLQPMLLGKDPLDVEQLWNRCYQITRWYGRKGVALSALGGIDIALWDIRGKVAAKPICELLNSTCRHSVPAYASALLWKDDPRQLAHEARRHLSAGFRRMKMRLGRNYQYDCAALDAVRSAIGPENDLIVEGNGRYSLDQARRIAEKCRQNNVYWFEEPFPPDSIDDYVSFRPGLNLPLAAGENEFGVAGFRELLERGTVDILQPDASRCGGITEAYRVGLLVARHGLNLATHSWSDAIALAANIHVIAALSNGLTVEIDQTGNELVNQLLVEPLRIREGEVSVPRKPGLGVEIDPDALARFTLRNGPIPDGNYSDIVFGSQHYVQATAYEPVPAA